MKNFRRALAVVLTFMLLVAGMVSSFSVSAAAEVYKCELGVNKSAVGNFQMMGFDVRNKKFYQVEALAKTTWNPEWPGHFVPNTDVYLFMRSERENEGGMIDLMPNLEKNWGSVVVFTATKSAKYHITALLDKFYDVYDNKRFYVDIQLVRGNDGAILFEKIKHDTGEVDILKKNVYIAEGESVYLLVTANSASTTNSLQNVALKHFVVTEVVEASTQPLYTTPEPETEAPDVSDTAPVPQDSRVVLPEINPIIVVALVGGVLVLTTVIIVIAIGTKKKKK